VSNDKRGEDALKKGGETAGVAKGSQHPVKKGPNTLKAGAVATKGGRLVIRPWATPEKTRKKLPIRGLERLAHREGGDCVFTRKRRVKGPEKSTPGRPGAFLENEIVGGIQGGEGGGESGD